MTNNNSATASESGFSMPELQLSMMLKFLFATIFFWGAVLTVIAATTSLGASGGEASILINVPTGIMMMLYAAVAFVVAKVSGDLDANTTNTGPISGPSSQNKSTKKKK